VELPGNSFSDNVTMSGTSLHEMRGGLVKGWNDSVAQPLV